MQRGFAYAGPFLITVGETMADYTYDPDIFDMPHQKAFKYLGAASPGRAWSSFDVSKSTRHLATKFVTTIWNYHEEGLTAERVGSTNSAILRDERGNLYYLYKDPGELGSKSAKEHWSALTYALEQELPITGILKNKVRPSLLASSCTFNCTLAHRDNETGELWLKLEPLGSLRFAVQDVTPMFGVLAPGAVEKAFEQQVQRAASDSVEARRTRLKVAAKKPRTIQVTTTVFERNPDVVAEVLFLANGVCQLCERPAPFLRRSNNEPYLEVHHVVPLSEGGDDTVENCVAICPNCHRKAHYGPIDP